MHCAGPAFAEDAAPALQDGKWQGTQWGYSSNITVEITIENGVITKAEAVAQDETPVPYWEDAVEIFDSIVAAGGTAGVDTISGATMSSRAILGATDSALRKAAGLEVVYTEPQADWFAGGDGSAENPFLIETADQLYTVASTVNGDINYANTYLKLAQDIDLAGIEWRPIGSNDFPFAGNFDGDGHVVSNLTIGDARTAYAARSNSRHLGLFGMVASGATLENVTLENVLINAKGDDASIRSGALAGQTKENVTIRNIMASGSIQTNSRSGNDVPGGIVGFMGPGTVLLNSGARVAINSTCAGNYVEAGGLVGMNNEGLIANCYALGDVTAKADGAASIIASALVAEQCGDVVNCYAEGNLTTKSATGMAGATSGDIDGGRTYNCWYNADAVMTIGGEAVTPVRAFGKTYSKTMDYPGTFYVGNMTMNLTPYTAASKADIAQGLNASFAAFPVDIKGKFGVNEDALKSWTVSGTDVVLTDTAAALTYARPAEEVIEQVVQPMQDGTWYGRDADKTTVVKITTEHDAVVSTEVLQGEASGAAYDAALAKAQEKAIYRDASDYAPADPSKFAGGTGTKEDPYQIATEAQLRYVAEGINEDNAWEDKYFLQTADIKLSKKEWLPIGYSVFGYYRSRYISYHDYPFLGNYDGGNHTISGLTIGTRSEATTDPRMVYTAGLFGTVKGTVVMNYPLDRLENPIQREIRNVKVEDMLIHTANENGLYAAGIIASANNGFIIDHCSVTGEIIASEENGVLYAGGLIGYGLRGGLISNSWADVAINATGNPENATTVYAGGAAGMQNRVTTINSYALGDVIATNKANAYVGGFAGYTAGANYNVFAYGSVTSTNETDYAGYLTGALLAIGSYYHAGANSDAALTVAGAPAPEKKLYGKVWADASTKDDHLLGAGELGGAAFIDSLNQAIKDVATEIPAMQEDIGNDPIHSVYYTGDGSDLLVWTAGVLHPELKETASPAAAKKTQTLKVTAKNKTYKVKALKKKAQTYKAFTVKGNKGTVKYTVKYDKKSKKVLKFNKKTGKITVKKGTKKGTYKVKITVKAAAKGAYKASKAVTKTIKVTVK